eukprot:6177175-Pleurochrysis_carterae.AAC.3
MLLVFKSPCRSPPSAWKSDHPPKLLWAAGCVFAEMCAAPNAVVHLALLGSIAGVAWLILQLALMRPCCLAHSILTAFHPKRPCVLACFCARAHICVQLSALACGHAGTLADTASCQEVCVRKRDSARVHPSAPACLCLARGVYARTSFARATRIRTCTSRSDDTRDSAASCRVLLHPNLPRSPGSRVRSCLRATPTSGSSSPSSSCSARQARRDAQFARETEHVPAGLAAAW